MLTKEMNRDVSCTVIAKNVAQHECKEPDDFYDATSPCFRCNTFWKFLSIILEERCFSGC